LPFVAPKSYFDLYNRDEFELAAFQQLPENAKAEYLFHKNAELRTYKPTPLAGKRVVPYPQGAISAAHQQELLHGYYAATSFIDSLIGDLLTQLQLTGVADNTIIVLWGDHGFHLGDHGLWGKHTTMEQANHVPFIIKIPGSTPRYYDSPVELLDIFPTLVAATDIAPVQGLQGNNLLPVIQSAQLTLDKVAISQYKRKGAYGYSMRTDRYRYTEWIGKNGQLLYRDLYDLVSDPLEQVNIIDNIDKKNVVVQLHDLLIKNKEGLKRLK
jgi:arylsulfatase A-like enzyme